MALINCEECGKEVSDKAAACPHCGAPKANHTIQSSNRSPETPSQVKSKKSQSNWPLVIALILVAFLVTLCSNSKNTSGELLSAEALAMCQYAIKNASIDPEKAEVPYVPDHGSTKEFFFSWGASTKMARMRNGLGLEVPVSASCTVSKSEKKINSLTLNGKTLF